MKTRHFIETKVGKRLWGSRRRRQELYATLATACFGATLVSAAILYLNGRMLS